MKGEEFLEKINDIDIELVASAEKAEKKKKPRAALIAAAACLALIAAITAFAKSGAFLPGSISVQAGGTELSFKRSGSGVSADSKADIENSESRALAAEECTGIFGAGAENFYAFFDRKTGELIYAEGEKDGTKLCVSQKGKMMLDAVVEGEENLQTVAGEKVAAGYFVTDPNSSGERTAIFYSWFEAGGMEYYAEKAGSYESRKTVGTELAELVAQIIEKGGIETDQLHY